MGRVGGSHADGQDIYEAGTFGGALGPAGLVAYPRVGQRDKPHCLAGVAARRRAVERGGRSASTAMLRHAQEHDGLLDR